MALSKLKIINNNNKSFEIKINPESISFNRSISYTDDNTNGTSEAVRKFNRFAPQTLSFDFHLDGTGIMYDKNFKVKDTLQELEQTVLYNGEKHEPNELTVSWGDIVFQCWVQSLNYTYTLFSPEGEILRAKIAISFTNSTTREKEVKKADKKSPDLSRIITLKAGESLPYWCNRIYSDPSYCVDIAKYNNLPTFRNIKPGTQLMFPPLVRN